MRILSDVKEGISSGGHPRIAATLSTLFLFAFKGAFFLFFLSRGIALVTQADHPL
jgi:hypothetical protein